MKIEAEVLSAEGGGDHMKISLQGKELNAADWRPYLSLRLEIPDTERNRRAFYVGRLVSLELKTRS